VRAFQAANGLIIDGVVGIEAAAALEIELSQPMAKGL
jgi:hypothetical protein